MSTTSQDGPRARLYPRKALLLEFRRNPEAAEAFAARLAHELMSLRTRLQLHNIRSASERVQNYLALNTGVDGRPVAPEGTAKDLAAKLGLTHEALYRTLNELEARGEDGQVADLMPEPVHSSGWAPLAI